MITARSPIGVPRAGNSRGPLHMLWLALLIVGLVYAHGVSTESAAHHLSNGASFSASMSPLAFDGPAAPLGEPSPTAGGEEHDSAPHPAEEHDSAPHPAEDCMPVQPQQGAPLHTPCASVSGDTALADHAQYRSLLAEGRGGDLPPAGERTTAILRT
ncbi:hypothetical protein [Streptomyces marianii]|uniref:Uncharacterized protein n=1 Tax=Streptomyces marianii TaxID=1817406 RepID=A0A5R9E1H1_9ACTN|nr:hypothetical protein [Streptomyces marianii]TLQ42194.1 hypothetical protein FEF34_02165 [Streptomyces marianii]